MLTEGAAAACNAMQCKGYSSDIIRTTAATLAVRGLSSRNSSSSSSSRAPQHQQRQQQQRNTSASAWASTATVYIIKRSIRNVYDTDNSVNNLHQQRSPSMGCSWGTVAQCNSVLHSTFDQASMTMTCSPAYEIQQHEYALYWKWEKFYTCVNLYGNSRGRTPPMRMHGQICLSA